MGIRQKVKEVRNWDEARPSFPAEHWLVLGAGLLVMRSAGKSRGFLGRMVGRAVGSALIARAASGRNGVVGKLASASAPGAGVAGVVRALRDRTTR
ncbi:hypothetical protein [Acidovorax sp. Leaf78]|uniref:hypothetical protein n=1 Tax=Acidovorax sp. Leaf78 TaxID=1736237 RepID=UPI00070086BD|nr:hypothetical protein [Acidovorax sp. Leaf78]KQO23285.1 hypothetical protein ASF16_03645 [Acidovorax sp. Leaf78]